MFEKFIFTNIYDLRYSSIRSCDSTGTVILIFTNIYDLWCCHSSREALMSAGEDRALLELNARRQTWCQVEGDPRQSWERADRKHYQGHRQTRSFAPLCPGERSTDRPAGGVETL